MSQIESNFILHQNKNTKHFSSFQIHKTENSKLRIKDEIKFLYMKREKLNNPLYKAHLKVAQEWGKTWYPIEKSINESLQRT
jgi:hypothetical protein